jgi:hypothetical protein
MTMTAKLSTGSLAATLGVALLATSAMAADPAKPAQRIFASPEDAVGALVAAAEKYDVTAFKEILGPDGVDLVVTQDPVQDRNQAAAWLQRVHEKLTVVINPDDPNVATVNVGLEDWPMPIPVVKEGNGWRFDSKAGREEIFLRRIGENELTAIAVCRRYVEAQNEYAAVKHDGALVNQYAQRIVSTQGTHDGLAWRDADGTWGGPMGEEIAGAIAEGYRERYSPYHGYYFKILKGQGPSAPLGELDFVVKGLMIGGFALVAAPAEYEKTGVKTFIVGYDGVVYEKDMGPATFEAFQKMERYDPDESWTPVEAP